MVEFTLVLPIFLLLLFGIIVFAHRVESTPAGIVLYGEYDSADMSYYAAEASEASHTVPPMASYYSGHRLNAAYYPQLVPAMIHRFAAIPVLSVSAAMSVIAVYRETGGIAVSRETQTGGVAVG